MQWSEGQEQAPIEPARSFAGEAKSRSQASPDPLGTDAEGRSRRLRSARLNEDPNRVSVLGPRRRRRRNQAAFYALAILTVSTVLAGWRIWQLERTLARMETTSAALIDEIHRMRREVSEALVRSAPSRSIDERDVAALRSRSPEDADLLAEILRLDREHVGWSESGDNPQDGFHSAGFVGYVLRETGHTMGFLELASDPGESSQHLFQSLRYKESPVAGDLVFYPGDIVLFYFPDRQGRPFVMGMTPKGIRAFDPAFAEPLGYREFRFGGRLRS